MTTAATIVERIALAITEEYPGERIAAASIAEQLAAVAEAEGIPVGCALVWIRDRPRHELSLAAWRKWCKRFRFLDATTSAESGSEHA